MVRKATLKDIPDVMKLGWAEYEEEGGAAAGMTVLPASFASNLQAIIEGKTYGEVLVATASDDKVVGMIIMQYIMFFANTRDPIAHEIGWYVYPEYRGCGLGKALLDAAEDAAASRGVVVVSLGVPVLTDYTAPLIKKYQEWGYIPFETVSYKKLEGKR